MGQSGSSTQEHLSRRRQEFLFPCQTGEGIGNWNPDGFEHAGFGFGPQRNPLLQSIDKHMHQLGLRTLVSRLKKGMAALTHLAEQFRCLDQRQFLADFTQSGLFWGLIQVQVAFGQIQLPVGFAKKRQK